MKKVYYYQLDEWEHVLRIGNMYSNIGEKLIPITDVIDPDINCYWFSEYKPLHKILEIISDIHWDNIRNNNKIIVIDGARESIRFGYPTIIEKIILEKHIKPEQIYFLVPYKTLIPIARNLIDHEINVLVTNWVISGEKIFWDEARSLTFTDIPQKKFSIFSRANRLWRTQFFYELIKQDLLKECHYTFAAINPYADSFEKALCGNLLDKEPDKSILVNEFSSCITAIKEWLNGVPYMGSSINYSSNLDEFLIPLMNNSDLHVVIETTVDDGYIPHFFTEKTFKPINAKKPFLIYSTFKSCHYLRELGFKTFDGIIDETYDTIEDHTKRRIAIVNEMKRINNLSSADYKLLLEKCQPIVDYNYKHYIEEITKPSDSEVILGILNL